jgi:ubiquinone/menaquinone biosynthesis C-methylase UbiE
MTADIREIADSFDARAGKYARNDWHRRCAERLVELCALQPGHWVMDAGTGTGFAALAAARVVGSKGRVHGIDISAGMLREARAAITASGLSNIELVQGNAVALPQYEAGTFDTITCAAGLLYMPVTEAFREWRRLLRRGGLVAFSTMTAGSPPGGRIFRGCAARFGVSLRDPSEPLGSIPACRRVLEASGFEVTDIVSETVEFSANDLDLAWESNSRSAGHGEVHRLSAEEQRELKDAYLKALAHEERERPGTLGQAEILYALGRS